MTSNNVLDNHRTYAINTSKIPDFTIYTDLYCEFSMNTGWPFSIICVSVYRRNAMSDFSLNWENKSKFSKKMNSYFALFSSNSISIYWTWYSEITPKCVFIVHSSVQFYKFEKVSLLR